MRLNALCLVIPPLLPRYANNSVGHSYARSVLNVDNRICKFEIHKQLVTLNAGSLYAKLHKTPLKGAFFQSLIFGCILATCIWAKERDKSTSNLRFFIKTKLCRKVHKSKVPSSVTKWRSTKTCKLYDSERKVAHLSCSSAERARQPKAASRA